MLNRVIVKGMSLRSGQLIAARKCRQGALLDSRLIVPSYAKVNYTLDVLSPRPDGYHNIATVMQAVSLADTVELERTAGNSIQVECENPDVPSDATNLAYRAAASAFSAVGVSHGITIRLAKRIPSQAGLGGGSSNAAATLRGLNRLFDLGLSTDALRELAAGLGS